METQDRSDWANPRFDEQAEAEAERAAELKAQALAENVTPELALDMADQMNCWFEMNYTNPNISAEMVAARMKRLARKYGISKSAVEGAMIMADEIEAANHPI